MENVLIGNLYWTTTNLNTNKFRNGDLIPIAHSIEEIIEYADLEEPCCCYYEFDKNNNVLGLLYNWYAVNDDRGLAPEGYYIPSHEDVFNLREVLTSLNENNYEDEDSIENGVLFNKTSFNPKASGYLNLEDGSDSIFTDINYMAFYWTSDSFTDREIWAPNFTLQDYDGCNSLENSKLVTLGINIYTGELKGAMLSVRCVKQ